MKTVLNHLPKQSQPPAWSGSAAWWASLSGIAGSAETGTNALIGVRAGRAFVGVAGIAYPDMPACSPDEFMTLQDARGWLARPGSRMRLDKQVNLRKRGELPAPSADGSRAVNALLLVLSVIAGCTDVIGYLGLDGLFTSHITGNLVLLAAHVDGGQARVSKLLAVPVYLAVVSLTTLLSDPLRPLGVAPLRLLLLLQFLLLTGFLGVCVTAGARIDPHAADAILAGMLGVSAMAVQNQNALVQIAFEGMPPTAMMTGNVTRFAINVIEALRRGDPARLAKTRHRAVQTLSMILGFASGCTLGAACEAAVGMWSLALPAGMALLAFAMSLAAEPAFGARTSQR